MIIEQNCFKVFKKLFLCKYRILFKAFYISWSIKNIRKDFSSFPKRLRCKNWIEVKFLFKKNPKIPVYFVIFCITTYSILKFKNFCISIKFTLFFIMFFNSLTEHNSITEQKLLRFYFFPYSFYTNNIFFFLIFLRKFLFSNDSMFVFHWIYIRYITLSFFEEGSKIPVKIFS